MAAIVCHAVWSPCCLADQGYTIPTIRGDYSCISTLVICQNKDVLSSQHRHKSSGDRTVSLFLFSASKANYIDAASQVAVFSFPFRVGFLWSVWSDSVRAAVTLM